MTKSKQSSETYRVDNQMKESLKKRAQDEKRSKSSILRDAVKKYLDS